jgi:repressor LexA
VKGLTERQRAVLDWVVGFVRKHRLPPTLREIGRAFRISSPGVLGHLRALERKGYLKRGKLGARSLEITALPGQSGDDSVELPKLGRIAAGVPLMAIENLEGTIRVDRRMVGRGGDQHFAVRVAGDSMVDAGIFDGDTVILRKQETARDGDIVVALVDGEEATLKRFYREKRRIRLQPANSAMKPIYSRDVTVQGVARGVIRTLR